MVALAETWALLFYRRKTVVVNDCIFLNIGKLYLVVNNKTFFVTDRKLQSLTIKKYALTTDKKRNR